MADFPLVWWLREHFQDVREGDHNVTFRCDICGSKKAAINKEKLVGQCWKCRNAGRRKGEGTFNLLQLLARTEGVSLPIARERVVKLAGTPRIIPDHVPRARDHSVLPKEAVSLLMTREGHAARKLLERRGVPHLIEHCYTASSGKFVNRVGMPCRFLSTQYGSEWKRIYNYQEPKSLFHPDGMDANHVYTSVAYDRSGRSVYLAESILDAETFHGLGSSVSIYGSDFRMGHYSHLRKLGVETVYWALDGDAMKKTIKAIREWGLGTFENYIIPFAVGEDPNSVGREELRRRVPVKVENEWDLLGMLV